MTDTVTRLTFDEFVERYEPIEVSEDGFSLETYGEDLERVKATPNNRIWTVVDGDDGELYIENGYHFVNRVHYIITENEWEEGEEIVIKYD